ncbi:MAG: DUF2339 domain-containing protein, partial [Burkholderiales bacterium]|nr:DUF2339 domain-containing protein [Burkholderiales bacterium]
PAPAAASPRELTPPTPPAPREPNFIEKAIQAGRDWLLGGNTMVRVGIIVLFFGVAFLLKYAADNQMLPMEFRLAGVAAASIALLITGWRLRDRRAAYGLVLQGGGVGILYLNVFAATKLYHMLPAAAAMPLMIAICALSAFLAIKQDAAPLAFMGSAGGFLAPVLLSTGGGSHVVLFSYYALLNAGIFAIAWFKAWRPLNLLGFAFTFSIGVSWGVTAYRPELLTTTEPFLILFFLMYVGIALLYAMRRDISIKHYVDGTLVFGTPLLGFGLQAGLMHGIEFGLSWSAVALAAFYIGLASWLKPRREKLGLLFDSVLALAVIFGTVAVPLAFTGMTTGAVWAVEGAAIVWISLRQRRLLGLLFGLLLEFGAGLAFAVNAAFATQSTYVPVLNAQFIGCVLLALSGIFCAWRLHGIVASAEWKKWTPGVGVLLALWGMFWWIGGGLGEIDDFFHYLAPTHAADRSATVIVFAVLTAWLAHGTRRRLEWPLAETVALALVPSLALILFGVWADHQAPLADLAKIAAWSAAAMSAYGLLWRQQTQVSERVLGALHTLMFWTTAVLLTLQGYWSLRAYVPEGAWSWSAWAYGYGVLLMLLAGAGGKFTWPVLRYARAYWVHGAIPVAVALWGWSVLSVMSDGDASPLTYIPILNPLDIAQILSVMAGVVWLRRLTALGVRWHGPMFDFAALATLFLWFNAVILRTLHHHDHAVYDVATVFATFRFQQIFLVGWSAFAFLGLWLAKRDSLLRIFAMASAPLIALMWVWTFFANLTQDGGSWSRIPLLNPLDLVQLTIYGIAVFWLLRIRKLGAPVDDYRLPLRIAAGISGFVWLNAILLRTLHHWANLPYNLDDLSHSTLVQASVSVFWTVCALTAMLWATRRASRILWSTGAALMGVTVVKLFLFDLSHITGLSRIVAFIGIGVMLLLVGYFSPLPPTQKEPTP